MTADDIREIRDTINGGDYLGEDWYELTIESLLKEIERLRADQDAQLVHMSRVLHDSDAACGAGIHVVCVLDWSAVTCPECLELRKKA